MPTHHKIAFYFLTESLKQNVWKNWFVETNPTYYYYQMTKRLLNGNWFSSMELSPILVIDS